VSDRELREIAVDGVEVRQNVRRRFDEAKMEELVRSVREVGVLEPILVRPDQDSERLVLVAGERRLRAAREAGLQTIPAIVCSDLGAREAREVALIENLQRQDLDPIEEAEGFRELLGLGYKQDALAERLGVSQGHISNRLRLLRLPEEVRQNISREILSAGHGLALLKLERSPEMLVRAAHHLAEKDVPVAGAADAINDCVVRKGRALEGYGVAIDTAECETCEHNYSAKAWGREVAYCLNPECYDAKNDAVAAEKKRRAEERLAELGASGERVIGRDEIYNLPIDKWAWLSSYSPIDRTGCEGCEHRALVPGRDEDDEPSYVCLKRECLEAKEKTAREEAQRKRKEEEAAALRRVKAVAAEAGRRGVSRRELMACAAVALSWEYVSELDVGDAQSWLAERYGWEFEGALDPVDEDWDGLRERLEALTDAELLELIVEWIGTAFWSTEMVRWLLGDEEDAAADDPGEASVDAAS